MVELYIKDSEVAVLISPGFGAGWSTWNVPEVAYDKRIIEAFMDYLDNKIDYDHLCEVIEGFGYKDLYYGGLVEGKIRWIPCGIYFRIREYDGAESIEFLSDTNFWCALTSGKVQYL